MSYRHAGILIATAWVCSVTIAFLPIFTGWFAHNSTVQLYTAGATCGLHVNPIYAIISSCLSFYMPLIFMSIVYYRIFRIAQYQSSEIKKLRMVGSCQSDGTEVHPLKTEEEMRDRPISFHKDMKALQTLGTVMGCFIILWLPFFLMYVIMPFCPGCSLPHRVEQFIIWLGYFSCCINPCIYAYKNREFRMAFARTLAFTQSSCCRPVIPDPHSESGGR